jgi:hypothetical protein
METETDRQTDTEPAVILISKKPDGSFGHKVHPKDMQTSL